MRREQIKEIPPTAVRPVLYPGICTPLPLDDSFSLNRRYDHFVAASAEEWSQVALLSSLGMGFYEKRVVYLYKMLFHASKRFCYEIASAN